MGKRLLTMSARQQQLFDYIVAFKREHDGCAPNTQEMRAAMDLYSTSGVAFHLRRLEDNGLIRLGSKHQARMIEVVGGAWSPPAPQGGEIPTSLPENT